MITLSYVIPMLTLFFYCYKKGFLSFNPKQVFTKNEISYSEEIKYIRWTSIYMIGVAVTSNIGMIMTGSLLGLDAVAIFFIRYYLGYVLEIPAINFSFIMKPILSVSFLSFFDLALLCLKKYNFPPLICAILLKLQLNSTKLSFSNLV